MKPTKKQLDLLQVLNPFKGSYVTYEEAAKILGFSVRAIESRVSKLKKNSPEVYWKFKQLRKDMNAGQRAVNYPVVMDPVEIDILHGYGRIREVF